MQACLACGLHIAVVGSGGERVLMGMGLRICFASLGWQLVE